jgi:hypothetical protein
MLFNVKERGDMNVFGRQAVAPQIEGRKVTGYLSKTCRSAASRLSRSLKTALVAGTMGAVLVHAGMAQTTNGLITGTVSDPTGAVVPGASITVTDLGTNLARSATSDERGYYVIPQLPPAVYSVVVAKAGFASSARSGLQLHVNEQATIDVKLTIGNSVQRVNVTAMAPPLNTTSATLGDVVDHETTVDLPLNGRQFTALTLLSPGASPQQGPQQSSKTIALGAGAISPSVSGQRPQQNNFTMDGVMNNNIYTNIWAISPPPDALDEFNIQAHITDAQFAITSGANINIATRSGTDTFHGDLWEFIRNDDLDTQTYPATSRLPYRQNQYGFYFGGPARLPYFDGRKNTWFSGYWEGFRYTKSQTALANTLTTAMAGGDFSALLGAQVGTDDLGRPEFKNEIYDPTTSRPDPVNPNLIIRDPFLNNIIPAGRINAASALMLTKYYPAPNMNVAPTVLPNLSFTGVTAIASDVYGVRLDHRFGNNDTVFGRYNRNNATQNTPEALPGYLHSVINYAQQLVFGYTHLFGSSTVLQGHFADTHTNIANYDAPAGQTFVSSINWASVQPAKYGISLGPAISLTNGYSGIGQSDTINGPQNNYEYHADLSKVLRNHTMGAGFLYYHVHSITDGWNYSLGFTQNATSQGALSSTTGMGPASFLLGLPDTYSAWVGSTGINQSVRWYGGYLQDQWQVTRRLALTMAFRYDFVSAPDYNGRVIGSLNALTGQFCVNAAVAPSFQQATCPSGYFYAQQNGYQPRFGLAFKATDHTVLRGAFAKLDDHNNSVAQENQDERLSWPTSIDAVVSGLNRGLPNQFFNAMPTAASFFANALSSPFASFGANPNNKIPYSLEYNFGAENQFSNSLTFMMDYVGSVSRHLFVQSTANTAPVPGPGTVASREPYPQYGGVFPFDLNEGYSNYNGLQAQLKKSLSHGLFFNVAYTYSKAMDIQSTAQSSGPENFYNLRQDYGPADFDRRHMFVVSGVYSLPFGQGKEHLNHAPALVNAVAGNWNLGTITRLVSGSPFYALAGSDVANVGGSNQRAQRTGASPYLKGAFTSTTRPWLNPAAFTPPAVYTWGNESRNDLIGPPFKDVDLSVYKDIPVTERLKLQFRSEFFNIFNHSNYSTPANTVTSSSFGLITSAAGGRDIQFALKVMF